MKKSPSRATPIRYREGGQAEACPHSGLDRRFCSMWGWASACPASFRMTRALIQLLLPPRRLHRLPERLHRHGVFLHDGGAVALLGHEVEAHFFRRDRGREVILA